jgi:hypothetical protein
MSNVVEILEARRRLTAAGMGEQDVSWLQSCKWSDAEVPPIGSDAEDQAYRRREERLNAAISDLDVTERGDSLEGKLAAAIGARRANWRERDEDEDDR